MEGEASHWMSLSLKIHICRNMRKLFEFSFIYNKTTKTTKNVKQQKMPVMLPENERERKDGLYVLMMIAVREREREREKWFIHTYVCMFWWQYQLKKVRREMSYMYWWWYHSSHVIILAEKKKTKEEWKRLPMRKKNYQVWQIFPNQS